MKYKVVTAFFLAVIIYSCASKSSVPTEVVKKIEATPEVVAEGKSLYENNCAKCHKLYDTKDFSAEEWKPIVKEMQRKAHLNDLQGEKIYNYVSMK